MVVRRPVQKLELVLSSRARRGLACVNVDPADKEVLDLLQWWWSLREGRSLSQWDVVSRLMALALSHPEADLPPREVFKRV